MDQMEQTQQNRLEEFYSQNEIDYITTNIAQVLDMALEKKLFDDYTHLEKNKLVQYLLKSLVSFIESRIISTSQARQYHQKYKVKDQEYHTNVYPFTNHKILKEKLKHQTKRNQLQNKNLIYGYKLQNQAYLKRLKLKNQLAISQLKQEIKLKKLTFNQNMFSYIQDPIIRSNLQLEKHKLQLEHEASIMQIKLKNVRKLNKYIMKLQMRKQNKNNENKSFENEQILNFSQFQYDQEQQIIDSISENYLAKNIQKFIFRQKKRSKHINQKSTQY